MEKVPEDSVVAISQIPVKQVATHRSDLTPTQRAFGSGIKRIHKIAAAVTLLIGGIAFLSNQHDGKSSEQTLPTMKPQN